LIFIAILLLKFFLRDYISNHLPLDQLYTVNKLIEGKGPQALVTNLLATVKSYRFTEQEDYPWLYQGQVSKPPLSPNLRPVALNI
jgi:hypothetical protein